MYSNLIIGIDGRPGGRDAIALARALSPDSTRMALASVCVATTLSGRGANPAFDRAMADETRQLVEGELAASGLDADAVSLSAASVGSGLESVAAGREADLIVIGSCHRGVLGRVLTGDDAASVLHHAQRAVAIAPTGYATREHRIKKVGLAYDGSASSQVALKQAEALAGELGAELIPRHVASVQVTAVAVGAAGAYVEDREDLIARRKSELGHPDGLDIEVVVGTPAEQLDDFSEEVDLLICGSRHNAALRRIALGSTSDHLAHHSRCPLIVTPAGSSPSRSPVGPAEETTPAV